MNTAAEQDRLRTERQFISLISGAFGIQDQTYAGDDALAVNYPRQYQSVNPSTGAYSIEGAPISSTQQRATLLPGLLIVGALVVGYLVFKRR